MPANDDDTHEQREWQTSPQLWVKLRPNSRESRANPTQAENRLWSVLRNRGLRGEKFRRQHPIGRFLVDFYCARASLVIEVDGPIHASQHAQDALRQRDLETRGLKVVRFTNDEVLNELSSVTERIAAHLTPNPSPTSERGTGPT